MIERTTSPSRQRLAVAAIIASLAAPAFGQKVDEEPVELSPFTVTSDSNVGYLASSTLAGTRLNTELRDIAASIQIVTPEFIKDTAANDINEILIYTTNTESGGLVGNFSASSVGSRGIGSQGVYRSPHQATRVRGLGAADLTRDFFLTDIPFDAFNTSQVDINRGPNAILFGLGSPAGILNNVLTSASLARNQGEVSVEVDNFGSFRSTLNQNYVLVDDKLAFRIAGLYENQEYKQEPTFEEDRRFFAAVHYQPRRYTTIRANVEMGQIDSLRPNPFPPLDFISLWYDIGNQKTFDVLGKDLGVQGTPFTRAPFFFRQLGMLYSQPDAKSPDLFTQGVVNGFTITDPANPLRGRTLVYQGVLSHWWHDSQNWSEETIIDRNIFDAEKNRLIGIGGFKEDWTAYNVAVEQLFAGGKAGFEAAYNYQDYENAGVDALSGGGQTQIILDVTERYLDGRINPNLGRPFVNLGNVPELFDRTERDTIRLTAFLKHDFTESDGIRRWLGRHALTGFYNNQTIESSSTEHRFAWRDGSPSSNFDENLLASFGNVFSGAPQIVYVGPSAIGTNSFSDVRITSNVTAQLAQDGQNYRIPYWNIGKQAWAEDVFKYSKFLQDGRLVKNDIESYAFILQSHWLSDNLVTTVGWRKDDAEIYQKSALGNSGDSTKNPSTLVLPDSPTGRVGGDIWSFGLVGHWPKAWFDLPFGSSLSFHYNQSDNFQPDPGRVNILGESLPSPSGETEEYGFTMSLLDDKLVARVNWYETRIANASFGGGPTPSIFSGGPTSVWLFLERYFNAAMTGEYPVSIAEDMIGAIPQSVKDAYSFQRTGPYSFSQSSPAGVAKTTDFVAEGVEIEAVANLTENWRLGFNVAQQVTVNSSLGGAESRAIDAVRPVFEKYSGLPNIPDSGGTETVGQAFQNVMLIPLNTLRAQEGKRAAEQREWRVNVFTNYEFDSGDFPRWLRPFGVGVALRWQDKSAIGFPLVETPDGQLVGDVENPILSPGILNGDLWVSYDRLLFEKKIKMRLKLNVRNALRDDTFIPIFTHTDGIGPDGDPVAKYRISDPRTFILSASFLF